MALGLFTHQAALAQRVQLALLQFQQTHAQFEFDQQLLLPASEFVTRGKLFRGLLCEHVATALTQSASASKGVWSAAVALELAGSAILIQDDIMDNATLRRDQPTLHIAYQDHWQGRVADQARFGESLAVCVSDVLFFVAVHTLSQADLPETAKVALLTTYGRHIATLALAQAEELRFSALALRDPQVTTQAVTHIMIGKTARYTAMWPLEFAAILAGLDHSTTQQLLEFGRLMGLVFQLSDDRLGLFGDPAVTGKDTDSDVKTAKKTLYAVLARDTLTGAWQQEFLALYGKADITPTELKQLQELLITTGVAQQVDQQTQTYVDQAKHQLQALHRYPEVVQSLSDTLDFLVTRER